MVIARCWTRAGIVALLAAGSAVWYACSDRAADSPAGPAAPPLDARRQEFFVAVAAQQRHTEALLHLPGVVGTAITLLEDGRPGVQLLLERAGIGGLPETLDGVRVTKQVTGRIVALSNPTTRQRPAPLGYSVGHPLITAGTIGARVRDATGRVYVLSNNHVLANSNNAGVGDPALQPGPFDGGTAADQIATLSDFQTIIFGGATNNLMDAAVALSGTDVLDNATPADEGYGLPNSTIYGDANGDGMFDDRNALLGLTVQKYGRTTRHTHGQITGVNATVSVCYEVVGTSCLKIARFVDQLIIAPSGFSGGGDSGSLIVTDDGNLNPVALLFAGSSTVTIGNRIDLVLDRFGVTIDGFDPPPPGPFTDLAVTNLSGPGTAVQGTTATITATVRNFGNQDVAAFDVTLRDSTEQLTVGTQTVAGLAAGAVTTVTFAWNPAATGDHLLVAAQTLADDKAGNDRRTITIPVEAPLTDIAVTSMSAPANVIVGHVATIGVTVANAGNQHVASSITVTLADTTAGVTIGTQTIAGLAPGAGSTLTFSWNTAGAALGGHTLVAIQSVADDNASNDRRTSVVTVQPKPTDVALTGITAPSNVFQGDTAHVVVTVRNVGEVDVTATFTVALTDGTAGGVTVGTGTVGGLAAGATTTVDIPWNTAGAALNGHILIATSQLTDDVSTNNSIAIAINVKPPVVPAATDVGVTAVSAPPSVGQGSTATIQVTIQNLGGLGVAETFDLVLTDQTAGGVIGTQTINGLGVSASATRNFSWNTGSAALGNHTLVASVTLTDDNAANNELSAVVTVTPQPADLALAAITGPSSVFQGDTAPVAVTVQNVGGQDVTSTFTVVLTDGTAGGATIGAATIDGLAMGASATRTINWNTAGATIAGHILIATQTLADANSSNNARAVLITVKAPLVTDVAVSGVSAPGSVTQGLTASVGVTVQNVGGLNVGSTFDVVLTDQTAGVTIGTQSVAGLAAGTSATRTFSWNTTAAALGGHTLVATQSLADANAANDQASATVNVIAPLTDVSVSSLSAPGSVTQGSTAAIGVTVQNVGGVNVAASFDVVLTDQTAGVTIGTQTVTGLAAGATATRTFNWNTTAAQLGGHTVIATQGFADDNASNDQRSAVVTVTAPPTDLAVAAMTAPGAVTQGDTAHIGVTVQNVGGQPVATTFSVVLTDATAGVTVGTQTISGLAVGAIATLDFPWNTAGASTSGHILIAQQMLADANSSNNSRAVAVTVNPPSVHAGNLTGLVASNGNTWSATIEIVVHDHRHGLTSGVLVRGSWNGSGTVECTTGGSGACQIVASFPNATKQVQFAVTGMTRAGSVYQPAANHDPDGSSNGTIIIVKR